MTVHLARNGWSMQEKEALMEAVRAAGETGASLRSVFEETGQRLGRKPNSVRNFYYLQLRTNHEDAFRRAEPFVMFTEGEVMDLVRQVILAKSRGQSVRACVMAMAGGDKASMLRYQNKYRAILKKRPEMIQKICDGLEQEGVPCVNPLTEMGRNSLQKTDEKALQALDRLKVQADLMRMQLEDMQLAARAILLLCKDFLGLLPEERQGNLDTFCRELAERLAMLENAAN